MIRSITRSGPALTLRGFLYYGLIAISQAPPISPFEFPLVSFLFLVLFRVLINLIRCMLSAQPVSLILPTPSESPPEEGPSGQHYRPSWYQPCQVCGEVGCLPQRSGKSRFAPQNPAYPGVPVPGITSPLLFLPLENETCSADQFYLPQTWPTISHVILGIIYATAATGNAMPNLIDILDLSRPFAT